MCSISLSVRLRCPLSGCGAPHLLGVHANIAVAVGVKAAFDGLSVAFEGGFAPAGVAEGVGDLDEEPPGRDAEVFDRGYGGHDDGGSAGCG